MAAKTKNKRNEKQKENDYGFISKIMLQGYTVREMGRMVNEKNQENGYTLSHSQVYLDMKKILEEWRDDRKDVIDLVVDRELAKLDVIEKECWQAWEKSKGGKRKTKIEGGSAVGGAVGGGQIKERSIEDSHGDVRFLHQVLDCMDRRRDLLGIGAAKKIEFSGSVAVGTTYMDKAELDKERARLYKNMKIA